MCWQKDNALSVNISRKLHAVDVKADIFPQKKVFICLFTNPSEIYLLRSLTQKQTIFKNFLNFKNQ